MNSSSVVSFVLCVSVLRTHDVVATAIMQHTSSPVADQVDQFSCTFFLSA